MLAPFAVIPAVLAGMVAVHFVDLVQFDFLDPDRQRRLLRALDDTLGIAMGALFVGWFVNLVFGWPAFLALRYNGLGRPVPCALFGAIAGLLLGIETVDGDRFPIYLLTMLCGASVAALFARIANGPAEPKYVKQPGVWY